MQEPTIGEHLARLRCEADCTQEQLAERAGVSVEVIRTLEQGARKSTSLPTLHKLARALHVPTSALIGDASRATADREPDAAPLGLVEVRRALTPIRGLDGIVVTDIDSAPPKKSNVDRAVNTAESMYRSNAFADAFSGLPDLLTASRTLVETSSGDDLLNAYALNARAHQVAGRLLLQMRQLDLAHVALNVALDAAGRSGDDAVGTLAVRPMCWLLMRQGRVVESERLAIRTADRVEPRFSKATSTELAGWGWLLLYGAAAAARDNRADEAEQILGLAEAAAQRVDAAPVPPQFGYDGFTTAKVGMMRAEAAVVAGEPATALAVSAQIRPTAAVQPNCYQRWRLDVASSQVQTGHPDKAAAVLKDLAERAPAWLRHQQYARDIVESIKTQRRGHLSSEIAELESLVGYQP